MLKNNKNQIILLETKADILYSNSFIFESLLFYKEIIENYPQNHYVNKRIFDIKFNQIANNDSDKSKELFNEFSILLILHLFEVSQFFL